MHVFVCHEYRFNSTLGCESKLNLHFHFELIHSEAKERSFASAIISRRSIEMYIRSRDRWDLRRRRRQRRKEVGTDVEAVAAAAKMKPS